MHSKALLSILIVCMLLGLSFCDLRCGDHICPDHTICVLHLKHEQLEGQCHPHIDEHQLHVCIDQRCSLHSPEGCCCHTESCVTAMQQQVFPNHQAATQDRSLQCVHEICVHHEHNEHPICVLSVKHGQLEGHCPPHIDPRHVHSCMDHGLLESPEGCHCETAHCVTAIQQAFTYHQATKPDQDLHCGDHICHEHEICNLSVKQGWVEGRCHHKEDAHHIHLCVDHDSLRSHEGCQCQTENCVTAMQQALTGHQATHQDYSLHCVHDICEHNGFCELRRDHNTFEIHGSCKNQHDLHHDHIYEKLCEHHDYLRGRDGDCICLTQECINTVLQITSPVPTTTQPSTSTQTFTTHVQTTQPTTTTTIQTTASKTVCNVCGDLDIGIPCRANQINADSKVTCGAGYNYCMTDVVQDVRGNVDVFKRCVAQATCDQKWVVESSNKDYCRHFGLGKYTSAFECHFCCSGDGCNTNFTPDQVSWYTSGRK